MSYPEVALAALAERVLLLEEAAKFDSGTSALDNSDGVLLAQVDSDWKKQHLQLSAASEELGLEKKEKEALVLENRKLRYQIVQLKRSLDAEERR